MRISRHQQTLLSPVRICAAAVSGMLGLTALPMARAALMSSNPGPGPNIPDLFELKGNEIAGLAQQNGLYPCHVQYLTTEGVPLASLTGSGFGIIHQGRVSRVVTAGHIAGGAAGSPGGSFKVRFGTAATAAQTVFTVSRHLVHPDYIDANKGFTPDIGVLYLQEPFTAAGAPDFNFTTGFGTAPPNQTGLIAGFGRKALVGQDLGYDGRRRGGVAKFKANVVPAYSSVLYSGMEFTNGQSYSMMAMPGNSGSVAVNDQGKLVGVVTARSATLSDTGDTIYLDLTGAGVAAVRTWLVQTLSAPPAAPAVLPRLDVQAVPGSGGVIRILAEPASALAQPTGVFRLQESGDLQTWTGSYPFTGGMVEQPAGPVKFFRAVWLPN